MNPVLTLDDATRNKRLLDSFKKGDVVRENPRHPGEWLVSSSTYDRVFYRVQYDEKKRRYSCGCEWYQHKGQACRHLVRVSWHVHELRRQAKAAARKGVMSDVSTATVPPLPTAIMAA